MAIADVTIDACTAYNSNKYPSLRSDMQSLCSLSSSIGALLGFFMSGILVHLVGSKVSESSSVIFFIHRVPLMLCFTFRTLGRVRLVDIPIRISIGSRGLV